MRISLRIVYALPCFLMRERDACLGGGRRQLAVAWKAIEGVFVGYRVSCVRSEGAEATKYPFVTRVMHVTGACRSSLWPRNSGCKLGLSGLP